MKTYLVGGAVRDELLGLPLKEKDWVVVGETPETLKSLGFKQVGKEFPVFLHPVSREEYALARQEKKISEGHTGFSCQFSPEVTLEQDLFRRDLTINAIAKEGKNYIDPFHGQEDLKNRLLRHVSPAFAEDPLRVLRVARFLAQLSSFHFQVAPETLDLMKTMVQRGDLKELSKERVWGEIQKAVDSPVPEKFFLCLKNLKADFILSSQDLSVPTHPSAPTFSLIQKFAWFFSSVIDSLNFTPPVDFKAFAELVEKYASSYRVEKDPEKLLKILSQLDSLRRPERFMSWLEFHAAKSGNPNPQACLQQAAEIIKSLDFSAVAKQHKNPFEIQKAIEAAKLKALFRIRS